MTAKEYLSEVIKLKRKAESLTIEEENIRTEAEGLKAIVYDRDRVQVSSKDKMPDIIADLVDVQDEYAQTILECYRKIKQREEMVSALHSAKQSEVLRLRYIKDNNGRQFYFSEIAEIMGIENVSSIIRLHKRALKSFTNMWHDALM